MRTRLWRTTSRVSYPGSYVGGITKSYLVIRQGKANTTQTGLSRRQTIAMISPTPRLRILPHEEFRNSRSVFGINYPSPLNGKSRDSGQLWVDSMMSARYEHPTYCLGFGQN